jgi:hypothetical protein
MEIPVDQNSSYRVEVSGWDALENFFVEKTTLDWGLEEKKEISLRSPLREGSVVFVRLLQPLSNSNSFPIAYQAVDVAPNDSTGRMSIHLAQLRPRVPYRETAMSLSQAMCRVA